MSLLGYTEICALIEAGVIEGADFKDVNSASLDIHLGTTLMVEVLAPKDAQVVSLAKKENLQMSPFDLKEYGHFILQPGAFILAHSKEIFHMPNNISAQYKLNSSMARIGLEHLKAGWCDAGWNGSVLTLELKNMTNWHRIRLDEGVRIGQMIFFKHAPVPKDKSYSARGRYNGDLSLSQVKSR